MDFINSFVVPLAVLPVLALGQSTATTPGQPSQTGSVNQFVVVGDSGVSAQQLFLGTEKRIYVVDKVEGNPLQINGHPAWATEYTLGSNSVRAMDIVTNSFCAGGGVTGDGTWLNVGGNQAVTYGGLAAASQTGGGPYDDPDGRNSLRVLKPCDDGSCNWSIYGNMTTQRWYPTLEGLEDGSLVIFGGCKNGGYVNDQYQDNPTYEFFPSQGAPVNSNILATTLPTNLYPLTWLLPSGKILIQSNWNTALLNYHTGEETPLDDMPDAVRTYPASAGTIMLPLTPANNWTATVMFCGGTDLQSDQWDPTKTKIVAVPAVKSCQKITPDVSGSYTPDDPLPVQRTMLNLIFLPDGRIFGVNGAQVGTAGYGNDTWAIGQSYADQPVLTPVIYDPEAPSGQRWSSEGLGSSNIPRMYHSSATLTPEGDVFIAGSNPNADYNVDNATYPTEYRTERFYPSYFNERRPQPKGLLSQLSYGGSYFDVTLDSDDLFSNITNIQNTKAVIIRTGFSTHSMNMGQRYVELQTSYTGYDNNTAVLHVSQLPPNPAIITPGPALLFVVVNGVPSVGVQVMLGSGKVGTQTTSTAQELPTSQVLEGTGGSSGSSGSGSSSGSHNAAVLSRPVFSVVFAAIVLRLLTLL